MTLRMTTETLPGGHTLLTTAGEIDVYSAIDWRNQTLELIREGAKLIVDLTEVNFLDSTGLGGLVVVLQRIRAMDGTIALVISTESIWEVFRKTGLANVFPSYASVKDAINGRELDPTHRFS